MMVVDDNSDNRRLLRELLLPLGVDILEAESGKHALERWREFRPRVIWLDIRMPDMDGFEVLNHIREEDVAGTTRVIAVTASAFEEDRLEILAAGFDAFLGKPFHEKDIRMLANRYAGACLLPDHRETVPESPRTIPEPRTSWDGGNILFPGIDTRDGLERARGNRLLYRKLLMGFLEKYGDVMASLRTELAAGDLAAVRNRLHDLRGVAGNVGARAIYDAALDLGMAIRENRPLAAEFDRLEEELRRVMEGLRDLSVQDAGSPDEIVSPRYLRHLLDDLEARLVQRSEEAATHCDLLKKAVSDNFQLQAERLETYVIIQAWDQALSELARLRAAMIPEREEFTALIRE